MLLSHILLSVSPTDKLIKVGEKNKNKVRKKKRKGEKNNAPVGKSDWQVGCEEQSGKWIGLDIV